MRQPDHPVTAAPSWRQQRGERLQAAIQAEPWRWDYHQLLRRFECLHPELPRLGQARRPADEPLRLGQEPALTFAPASLAALQPGRDGAAPRLQIRFLGLFGPNGPLPLHLTEHARERLIHAGDAGFARFADVIQHRFLCLFHRAWVQAQPCASLDRPAQDHFGARVAALCGLQGAKPAAAAILPDSVGLGQAGLFADQVRHAEGLAQLLTAHFGMPVAVEQFVGRWLGLRERDRTRLGRDDAGLGRGALLGARVWDRQHGLRLHIGPLKLAEYGQLLPGSGGLAALVTLVRQYAGVEYDWDARLSLDAASVPRLRLSRQARLGHDSWLGPRPGHEPAAGFRCQPGQVGNSHGGLGAAERRPG